MISEEYAGKPHSRAIQRALRRLQISCNRISAEYLATLRDRNPKAWLVPGAAVPSVLNTLRVLRTIWTCGCAHLCSFGQTGGLAIRHSRARSSWDESSQPSWLTPELFTKKIQPRLDRVATSFIRSSLAVSRWYASRIQQGYRPHPRHWHALAKQPVRSVTMTKCLKVLIECES